MTGRTSATYPALKSDVEATGARFVDGAAVIDGRMVSARAWPDHPQWMRAFMIMLKEKAPVIPLPCRLATYLQFSAQLAGKTHSLTSL